MKGCSVKLNLLSKKVLLSCASTTIAITDISMPEVCLSVSPANDQCNTKNSACGTRSSEWSDMAKKRSHWVAGTRYTAYWHFTPGSEPQLAYEFFCQDQGVYWSHIDNNSRYTVIIYKRLLDANLPIVPSYESGNTFGKSDIVIPASKMKMVERMQKELLEIQDYTTDATGKAISDFRRTMDPAAANITRIIVPVADVLQTSAMRQSKIAHLLHGIEGHLVALMVDALRHTEWYRTEMEVAAHKCCKLSFDNDTLVVSSVAETIYKCPGASYFYRDNVRESGQAMGPDKNYYFFSELTQLLNDTEEYPEGYYLVCPDTQDIVFSDNETLTTFKASLLGELQADVLRDSVEALGVNVDMMLAELDAAQENLTNVDVGFFNEPQLEYSVSTEGYDVQLVVHRNWVRVFSVVGGVIFIVSCMSLLMWHHKAVRKLLKWRRSGEYAVADNSERYTLTQLD